MLCDPSSDPRYDPEDPEDCRAAQGAAGRFGGFTPRCLDEVQLVPPGSACGFEDPRSIEECDVMTKQGLICGLESGTGPEIDNYSEFACDFA